MGEGDFRDLKVFRVFKDFKVLRDIRLQGREDMPLTLFIYIGEGHAVIFVPIKPKGEKLKDERVCFSF